MSNGEVLLPRGRTVLDLLVRWERAGSERREVFHHDAGTIWLDRKLGTLGPGHCVVVPPRYAFLHMLCVCNMCDFSRPLNP